MAQAQTETPSGAQPPIQLPAKYLGEADLALGFNWYTFSAAGLSDTTFRLGVHLSLKGGYRFSPILDLVGIFNGALTFGSDATPVPLSAIVGLQLEKALPVDVTLGVGFTLVAGFTGVTPVGIAFLGQAFWPLPHQMFGLQAQIQENILNNDLNLFTLTAGVGIKF